MNRRAWIQSVSAALLVAILLPLRALAAAWNKAAFDAPREEDALQGLGAAQPQPTQEVVLLAPDVAENGAVIQIEVESRLPHTEAIAILAAKNPTPLIANFMFAHGAEPYLVTRIKMAETAELKAIVRADGRYYFAVRTVEVAVGGCG